MIYRSWAATDIGGRRTQEDDYLLSTLIHIYLVADGVGGANKGAVASAIATNPGDWNAYFRGLYDTLTPEYPNVAEEMQAHLVNLVENIHRRILERAKAPNHHGMKTTLSALVLFGGKAYIAHVGDSRIYLCARGRLTQLTMDQTMAWRLAQAKVISLEDAAKSPHRHTLGMALGMGEPLQVMTSVHRIRWGDCFLLCTDGLYRAVPEVQIAAELELNGDRPELATQNLMSLAKTNDWKDNTTAIVVAAGWED